MNKTDIFYIVLLVIFTVIIGLAINGCSVKKAVKMDCKTETTIKRSCDMEGEGAEVVLLPSTTEIMK